MRIVPCFIVLLYLLASANAFSQETSGTYSTLPRQASDCSAIENDSDRLKCFDTFAREEVNESDSAIGQRRQREDSLVDNVFGLIAYRPNYFLFASYMDSPNEVPFNSASITGPQNQDLDNTEAKFQFSFKTPVYRDVLDTDISLWFGYTQLSLWQIYNKDASHPFRESNYEPEIFAVKPLHRTFGSSVLSYLVFGLNHQSNGRSKPLSRSWNRLYINSVWGHNRWAISFRPWYDIPRDREDDDNPDIYRYMGYFDLSGVYKTDSSQYSVMFRASRDEGHHHITGRLTWSFPVKDRFSAYVELFNGYGETLVDYNHRNKRVGVGILLSDWL